MSLQTIRNDIVKNGEYHYNDTNVLLLCGNGAVVVI